MKKIYYKNYTVNLLFKVISKMKKKDKQINEFKNNDNAVINCVNNKIYTNRIFRQNKLCKCSQN